QRLARQPVLPQPSGLVLDRRRSPARGGRQSLGAASAGADPAGLAGPARPGLAPHQPAGRQRLRAGRRRTGRSWAVRRAGAVAVLPAHPGVIRPVRDGAAAIPPARVMRPGSAATSINVMSAHPAGPDGKSHSDNLSKVILMASAALVTLLVTFIVG